ncbi:MAG TPA: hypothetical protein VK539_25925 [Myxococcaceae bacterium]|nr:hypothetical protein [Myxococcaceae bacterium]
MLVLAAVLACVIFAGLTIFQALLIAGLPLGHLAWGGQHRVLPAGFRIGSAISIMLYGAFALLMLERAGIIELLPGDAIEGVGLWVLTGYFALGIVMNAISRSKPERYTMTPVALVLTLLCLVLALG